MFTRLQSWWQSRQRQPDTPIITTDDGFSFRLRSGEECTVKWEDIQEIRAFKLDLLTTDEVRFSFKVGTDLWFEVSEEQPGFETII